MGTANIIELWSAAGRRPVTVLHDTQGFTEVPGAGQLPALSLRGNVNIDHVVRAGEGAVVVESKFVATGVLTRHDGKAVIPRHNGERAPQP